MPEHNHAGHRKRLKQRFLRDGLDSFEPHNVLELLLFYAIPKQDTNEIAHNLLARFGTLADVFNAPIGMLTEVKGVGEHVASLIKMVPELSRLYMEGMTMEEEVYDSYDKLQEFFRPRFIGRLEETLFVAGLDDAARMVRCEMVSQGSRSAVDVPLEKLVDCAMRWHVDRLILAHNHPNGVAVPSLADELLTQRLDRALASLSITLADHIIVGRNGDAVSLRKYGTFGQTGGSRGPF